jgi:hypothetical protein
MSKVNSTIQAMKESSKTWRESGELDATAVKNAITTYLN